MSEIIEFTATRELGHVYDVRLKKLRRELTRLATVVPDTALIRIENVSTREGTPAYNRRIVASWSEWK